MSLNFKVAIASPKIEMLSEEIFSNFIIDLNKDVLPVPVGPIILVKHPDSMSKFILFNIIELDLCKVKLQILTDGDCFINYNSFF